MASTTNSKKINIYEKRLLSLTGMKANWLDFLVNKIDETVAAVYQSSAGVLDGDTIGLSSPGNDLISLDLTNANRIVVGGGQIVDISQITGAGITSSVPFENDNLVLYHVAVKFAEIPDGIELNPRTGDPEYPQLKQTYGELGFPTSLTDTFGSNLRVFINSITQSGVDHSGRTVKVWLVDPVSGVEATAFFSATSAYAAPNNYVDIPYSGSAGPCGQDTSTFPPSTTATDYKVFIEGITIADGAVDDLRTDSDYAFIGIVTGNGPAATPTAFNLNDQTPIFIISLDKAYDGPLGSGDGKKIQVDAGDIELNGGGSTGSRDNTILTSYRKTDTSSGQIHMQVRFADDQGGEKGIATLVLAPVNLASGSSEVIVDEPVTQSSTNLLTFTRGGAQDLTAVVAQLVGGVHFMHVQNMAVAAENALYLLNSYTATTATLKQIGTEADPASWGADTGTVTVYRVVHILGNAPFGAPWTLMNGVVHVGIDGEGNDRKMRILPFNNTSFFELYSSTIPLEEKTHSTDTGIWEADGLRITPDPQTSDTEYVLSLEPDSATPMQILHPERQARLLNTHGSEIFRYEPQGRWADGHRLKEDFFYVQSSFDSGVGATGGGDLNDMWEYNLVPTAGSGNNQRASVADVLTTARRGGNLFMRTDDAASDQSAVTGQALWEIRSSGPTNEGRLHFYCKLIPKSATTSVTYRIGFASDAGSPRLYWEIVTGGANVWTLIADNGTASASGASSVAVTLNAVHHLYITVDPFAAFGTGSIYGYVRIDGSAGETVTAFNLPVGGTNLEEILKVMFQVKTNNTVEKDLMIDYVEVWDEFLASAESS